ncbi:MAG: Wzz/FepE/Etk N-terminal domain-containing protein [Rubrivivax sp.]|nr:Wzz/FepE/Etk N-terminal domain-containing protein [Rubrivivax sp.]
MEFELQVKDVRQGAGYDPDEGDGEPGVNLGEWLAVLQTHIKLLALAPLAVGAVALGVTYLIAPTYTASTTFLPPQQAQSSAASALASLGALGGLAGGITGVSSPGERYVALMQSVTLSDRIVDHFKLMEVYEAKFRVDARKVLASNLRITLGKKDGLLTIQVDDEAPQRAADMANRYVEELRRLTGTLAVTEAQQRRAFFEKHLQQSRDRLVQAQQALEASGFSSGALKAEPKAAAEAYARLKAETTGAEMRLGLLRSTLTDGAPEVRQQLSVVQALRGQLARAEGATSTAGGPDYVGRYREFKYQETLFEVYARQFELARSDESREGALIQVVDPATPPERRSKPKRALTAVISTLAALLGVTIFLLVRHSYRHRRDEPLT